MSEDNNKLGDNLDKTSKTPKNLGEDFEVWMKGPKEKKDYLTLTAHNDTQSELSDLRESFGPESFEKGRNSTEIDTPHSTHKNNSNSSFETVQTRQERDKNKNIFQGATESIYVPFRALKDVLVDATRMAFSPVQETKRTLVYLEKESSAKII